MQLGLGLVGVASSWKWPVVVVVLVKSCPAIYRVRRIPRLHYGFDDTEAEAEGIERVLYELKQKGEL